MACRDANKSEAWRLVAASRPLIFVAEDDPDLRPMLGEILGDAGYRAVLFETAEKLLASLDGATPAAIVTDIAMPGLSGAGLLAKLRRNEDWRGIPVVVMTANNDTALPLRLDVPVVYKPDTDSLIPAIETLLRARRSAAN
jgi:CheY-like chemotaxis protein